MSSNQNIEQIVLTASQLKQIARYELTFKDIISKPVMEDIEIVCPDVYFFTLDDLTTALHNLKSADPTVDDFGEFWFYPIQSNHLFFQLDRACGNLEDVDDTPEELRIYYNLPVSDSYLFDDIWYDLDCAWSDNDDDLLLSEVLNLDRLISDVERYAANKGKPITEWVFTNQEKKNYIRRFEEDDHVKKADERELLLARKFIDELCAEDLSLALRIKGYACYGGNRLYPCDWNASRDCILRLFEKTDEPQYANTLGYIFYYGRCTGGEPEYEKAFHYFGIAAANGLYEGMYKLADMFHHGYGCDKSETTAARLYNMVYADSIKHFLQGEHANFADAALRLGNVHAKGIGERVNPEKAYLYYTQADYAAKIRAKNSDFFGNTTVVINIQKALEETRAALPEDYFRDYIDHAIPSLLWRLTEDRFKCQLTRTLQDDGEWLLTGSRIATKSCKNPDSILITYPQIGLCERTISASMTTVKVTGIWFKDDAALVRYDSCGWNDKYDRYEFYYDEDVTAWIQCSAYRILGKQPAEASGPEYRLVSIRFSANGRTYDYICEYDDVQIGDTVIVDGYDGETEVEVVGIRVKKESELGLPVERYKKVKKARTGNC